MIEEKTSFVKVRTPIIKWVETGLDNFNETYLLIVVYIVFLIFHLLISLSAKTPLVYADEAGYIQNARDLINGIVPKNTYYPGYSICIIPAFLISNDIQVAYVIVHIINSLLMAFIPVLSYKLITIYDGSLSRYLKVIITLIVSTYPSYILYSNFAMAEALFIPLFLFLALQVYYLAKSKGKRKYLWVTAPATYAYLVFTHPRAFAILPAFLITLLLIVFSNSKIALSILKSANKRVYIFICSSACFVLLILIAFFVVRSGGGYSAGYIKRLVEVFSLEGMGSLIITWAGQMYYLIISTFGLVLFGYYYGIRYIIKHFREYKENKLVIFYLFIILSLFFLSLLSAWFMMGHTRVDHLLYGRYNEGVLLPVFIMGLICIEKKDISTKAIIVMIASTFSIFLLLYVTRLNFLNNSITNNMNVFGIYSFTLLFKEYNLFYCTIYFSLLFFILYLIYIKSFRTAMYIIILFFSIITIYINGDFFHKGSSSRLEQNQIITFTDEYSKENNNCNITINYDSINSDTVWHYFNYGIYRPEISFIRFRSPNIINSKSDLIISGERNLSSIYKSATIIAMENFYPINLYILPGAMQDYFISKGYVLPEEFPCALPDEAFKSSIKCDISYKSAYDFNKKVTLPIIVQNKSKKYFWPNLFGVKSIRYSVRLGIKLIEYDNSNIELYDGRVDLPNSLYPDQAINLSVPLGEIMANINDGKYILRFDMVQDMVTWFSQKGGKPLNLIVEVRNGTFTIDGELNNFELVESGLTFKKIKLSHLLANNKRGRENSYYTENLFNFLGSWTENGYGEIKNIDYKVDKDDYYFILKTKGWNPYNGDMGKLNLHVSVNNEEIDFSHFNSNTYYFVLNKNIDVINNIKIFSSTFTPIETNSTPKLLGTSADSVLKDHILNNNIIKKHIGNNDANKYGIDVDYITTQAKYESVSGEITYDSIPNHFYGMQGDNIWTQGVAEVKDISYQVKQDDKYVILDTNGWNPYKDSIDKLGLEIHANGSKLEFSHISGNSYYYFINKSISKIHNIIIKSNTFIPKDVLPDSKDSRELGIDIKSIRFE